MTIATIKIGGQQFRVKENEEFLAEIPEPLSFEEKKGIKMEIKDLVLVEENESVLFGDDLKKFKVSLEVVGTKRSDKIATKKFEQRKRYRKFMTSRREFVRFKVVSIEKS